MIGRLSLHLCLGLSMLLSILGGTGCAAGREHAYHTATIRVPSAQPAQLRVALAVQDQRAEVVNGKKDSDFVGLSRGGWGNPFDVTTASDQPLADDMATSLSRSLNNAGYQVRVVRVPTGAAVDAVVRDLAGTGAERLMLVRLDKWKSDTYQNTALHYDVELNVFAAKGARLARVHAHGNDNLGGSVWNPGAHGDQAAPRAFISKFEMMLNDYNVVQAMRPQPAGSSPHAATNASVPRS